jgi:hypothetical protein
MMASSPDRGVVNPYLQHWQIPNHFVLGTSTFPNRGSANPTPTILALTYRTAGALVDPYLKKPAQPAYPPLSRGSYSSTFPESSCNLPEKYITETLISTKLRIERAYMATIYVSYHHGDRQLAQEIVARLREQGHAVAIDVDDLRPGEDWRATLNKALEQSEVMVVLITEQALSSQFIFSEIGFARALAVSGKGIRIIPVILDKMPVPQVIADLSSIIETDKDLNKIVSKISSAVAGKSVSTRSRENEATQKPGAPRGGLGGVFSRLTPSAHDALCRADGIRKIRRQRRVHMEHLMWGLYESPRGQIKRIFREAGIEAEGLSDIIFNVVNVRIPPTYTPSELSEIPAISEHVQQGLEMARQIADERGSRTIRNRHLLYGALCVEACSVVKALVGRGVRKENIILPRSPDFDDDLEPKTIGDSSVSDQPTTNDTLGFRPYVEAVAKFLASADTKPPLTLSVEGEWAQGKSSFMLQLEQRLKNSSSPGQKPLIVRFNAWRHDKEDALWATFALEFLHRIRMQKRVLRRWWGDLTLFFAQYRWKNGWTYLVRAVALWAIFVLICVLLPIHIYRSNPQWPKDLANAILSEKGKAANERPNGQPEHAGGNTIEETGKNPTPAEPSEDKNGTADMALRYALHAGGWITYLAIILTFSLKAKEIFGNPFEVNLKKYLRSADYEGRVAFIEQFHEDFRNIIKAYAGGSRVYVFVDDLDRCELPRAAELMQALNLLISDDPHLIFVLAMDREKVAAGLAVKYKDFLPYLPLKAGETHGAERDRRIGLEFGHSFLQKFIQMPFRVPDPDPERFDGFLVSISGGVSYKRVYNVHVVPPPPTPKPLRPPTPPGREPSPEILSQRRQRELLFSGESQSDQKIALMFAKTVTSNPRRLKQFLNLFRLQAFIANEIGLFDEDDTDGNPFTLEQLGKFVSIELRWPELLAQLPDHPDLISLLESQAIAMVRNEGHTGANKSARGTTLPEETGIWAKDRQLLALLAYGESESEKYLLGSKIKIARKLLRVSPSVPRKERGASPPDLEEPNRSTARG